MHFFWWTTPDSWVALPPPAQPTANRETSDSPASARMLGALRLISLIEYTILQNINPVRLIYIVLP